MRPGLLASLASLLLAAAAAALGLQWLLARSTGWPAWAVALLVLCLLLPLLLWTAAAASAPLRRLLRALQGAVISYREGDFSVSIGAGSGRGELGELLRLHAELGQSLREQRRQLAQRELLLDTVVQNTPLALLLVAGDGAIVYANLAARRLLAEGRSLVGTAFDRLVAAAPEGLRNALAQAEDQLFSAGDEHFHLSQRPLLLQGSPHRLVMLRHMTRELAREEVASWKRVIRVISHELNNSLAPISSLAHTGAELARRGRTEALPQAFHSIGERAAHLHAFLAGYARFAKLPQPRPEPVDWAGFVDRLATQMPFAVTGPLPETPGAFDPGQLEQALINLLKNAHEAGGPADAVTLEVTQHDADRSVRITVSDRGPGMSDAVLAQALLPFYSTKRSGTGLGLALAREIAEAHGGRIVLSNRAGGGLAATLVLSPRSSCRP